MIFNRTFFCQIMNKDFQVLNIVQTFIISQYKISIPCLSLFGVHMSEPNKLFAIIADFVSLRKL